MRWVTLLCFAAGNAAAEPFLHWPVDCARGTTCFVEDFVDRDDQPGVARDFTCGLNTRDAHKGTDIAIATPDAFESRVAVLAAADGTVRAMRDKMVDDWRMPGVTPETACGNAVVLDHDNGYTSVYCHLRLGSVAVRSGDEVKAGDVLGLVGLSGQTTHPHLHFGLQRDGRTIDPFSPTQIASCGEPPAETLWLDTPEYTRTLLIRAGFSNAIPGYTEARDGTARMDTAKPSVALVVYAELGFAEDGDVVTITARGPGGEIFTNSRVLKSPRASQLPAFGRKAPPGGWPEGEYVGQITVTRNGTLVANRWAHITVTAS